MANSMKYAFGIDLGTTNSCIAVKTKGKRAQIIKLEDGRMTLPSCVMYKNGEVIVGAEAYAHRYDVKHVIYSSKREIGTNKKYKIWANGDDKPPVEITPIEVASEILKKLKHDAELQFGEGFITEATITVPAYFTHEYRTATIEAASLAGIKVVSLINEPTSAALAYTEGTSDNEKILVYDLGGGTFDVTLLNMIKPEDDLADLFGESDVGSVMAKVLSIEGDKRLGGDDLDLDTYLFSLDDAVTDLSTALKMHITVDSLRAAIGAEEEEKIILLIEGLKKSKGDITMTVPLHLALNGITDYSYTLCISSAHFSKALKSIFKKTVTLVDKCLKSVNMAELNKMILIGGSTKLEMLRSMLRKRYRTNIFTYLNPDEAVALGAAVYTSIRYGETNMSISDIISQSIGVECTFAKGSRMMKGRYNILIPKDTALPASAVVVLSTGGNNQRKALAPIYQGEEPIAVNNTHIGDIAIELTPSEEEVPVTISLAVDASGILTAKLSSQGKAVSATLQNILNPVIKEKTVIDKVAHRFRLMLDKVDGDDAHDKGSRAIDAFVKGELDYTAVKNLFSKLPRKEEKYSDDLSISPFAQATDRFHLADDIEVDDDYVDNAYEDDSDEE